MKKVEILAYSEEEAIVKAFEEHNITVIKSLSRWWYYYGKYQKPINSERFIADYMWRHKMYSTVGVGCIICTRKPEPRIGSYKIHNVVRKGRVKTTKVIELRRSDNDEILEVVTHKPQALAAIKRLVKKYKTDVYAITQYTANDIDMEAKFIPSPKDVIGKYLVYGIDESDVWLYERKEKGWPD